MPRRCGKHITLSIIARNDRAALRTIIDNICYSITRRRRHISVANNMSRTIHPATTLESNNSNCAQLVRLIRVEITKRSIISHFPVNRVALVYITILTTVYYIEVDLLIRDN